MPAAEVSRCTGIFATRSLSRAGKPENDLLPPIDRGAPMSEYFATPGERSGFKVVCNDCGSLSIKVDKQVNAPGTTPVRCGRCGAIRGTLADLHELALRSRDNFEF
jgi:hypothetical protein